MSSWNGLMDGAPPSNVVERFNPAVAEAVRAFEGNPSDENGRAVMAALAKAPDLDVATVDGKVGERRARIAALVAELDGEFRGLADDLGFRAWRQAPTSGYRRPVLTITRSRAKPTTSAWGLLADLGDISRSGGGSVNADRPRRQLTVKDFSRQGVALYDRDLVGAQDPETVPDQTLGRSR